MSITTIYKCDNTKCGATKEFVEHGVRTGTYDPVPIGHDLTGWGALDLGPDAEVRGIATPFMLCPACVSKAADLLGLKVEPAPSVPLGEFMDGGFGVQPFGGGPFGTFRRVGRVPRMHRMVPSIQPVPGIPDPSVP